MDSVTWTGNNLREVFDFCGGLNPAAQKCSWEEFEAIVRTQGLTVFTNNGGVLVDIGDMIQRYGDDLLILSDVVEIDVPENLKRECDVECDVRSRIATVEKATEMLVDGLAGDYIPPCQTKSYSMADYKNAVRKVQCQVDRYVEEIEMLESESRNDNENKKDAV